MKPDDQFKSYRHGAGPWLIAAGCCLFPNLASASDPTPLYPYFVAACLIPALFIAVPISLHLYKVHKRKRVLLLFIPILLLAFVLCAVILVNLLD